MSEFRPCILVPTYNNPATITEVVERVRAHLPDVVVVDDASGPEAAGRIDALANAKLAHVHRRAHNGGKGAAVKSGLQAAQELGYTHALQVDADGQHELDDIPRFLAAAREQPRGSPSSAHADAPWRAAASSRLASASTRSRRRSWPVGQR